MKTAEEWAKSWIGPSFNKDSQLVKLFKQIQLDAWKQGMTDAASLVDNWDGPGAAIHFEIKQARDNKTSI